MLQLVKSKASSLAPIRTWLGLALLNPATRVSTTVLFRQRDRTSCLIPMPLGQAPWRNTIHHRQLYCAAHASSALLLVVSGECQSQLSPVIGGKGLSVWGGHFSHAHSSIWLTNCGANFPTRMITLSGQAHLYIHTQRINSLETLRYLFSY